MKSEMIPLTAAHTASLAVLHGEGFDAPWSAQEFAELIAMPGAYGFALQSPENQALEGFVLARLAASEMEIITLVVARTARGRGCGTALMQMALETARGKGADVGFLEVADDNLAALALYKTLGYEEVGRRPDYYGGEGRLRPVDARVLRIALAGCASKGA